MAQVQPPRVAEPPAAEGRWFGVTHPRLRGTRTLFGPQDAGAQDLAEQLTAGRKVEPLPAALTVEVLIEGHPLAWGRTDRSVIVVNEAVAAVLRERAGDDVQLIAATLDGYDDPQHILVITRLVDCLDVQASGASTHLEVYGADDLLLPPDDIATYDKLVIVPDKVPEGVQVFRIARLNMHVVVSRDLACALAAAGITGVGFAPVG